MHIPIPIPIGVRRVATARGSVLKVINCQHCQMSFAYSMKLEAQGDDHDLLFLDAQGSANRAQQKAKENLLSKSHNCALPVPCPNCGLYNEDMVRLLKEEASVNWLQVAGGVVVVVSCLPLVFDLPFAWPMTIAGASIGLALLVLGYALAFRYDPNAGDPEPRKSAGRQVAIWGEELEQSLKEGSGALPDTVSNIRPNE